MSVENVYRFDCYYESSRKIPKEVRYIVAKSKVEAKEKIKTYIEIRNKEFGLLPFESVSEPIVEVQGVIV